MTTNPRPFDPRAAVLGNEEHRQENLEKQAVRTILERTVGYPPSIARRNLDLQELNRYSNIKFGSFKFKADRTNSLSAAAFLNPGKRTRLPELAQLGDLMDANPNAPCLLVTKYSGSNSIVGYYTTPSWPISAACELPTCAVAKHNIMGDAESTPIMRARLVELLAWFEDTHIDIISPLILSQ